MTDLDWPTEQDRRWAERVLVRAAVSHGAVDIGAELDAVHDAVIDTGSSARELFGPADDYARQLAEQAAPAVRAAEPDWPLSSILFFLGLPTLFGSLLVWLRSGWSVDVTPRAVAVATVVVVGMTLIVVAVRQWRSGRRGCAAAVVVAVLAVVVGGVSWAFELSATEELISDLPVVVIAAVGLGLIAAGLFWPDDPEVVQTGPVGTPEEYLRRLEGLLRGRHHLSASTARDRVTLAREHWVASGAEHPFEEFGAPEAYALDLADQTPESATRGRRLELGLSLLAVLVVVSWVVEEFSSGPTWVTWTVAGVLAVGCVLWLAGVVLGRRERGAGHEN